MKKFHNNKILDCLKSNIFEIVVFIICLLCLVILVSLSVNAYNVFQLDKKGWYGFIGSFWGAGVALILSIISVFLNIYFEKKRKLEDKIKEIKAMKPYFKIYSDSLLSEVDKNSELVELKFKLKNIGKGPAHIPSLFKPINNSDDETLLKIIFFLVDLPIIFECGQSIEFKVICKNTQHIQDSNLELTCSDMIGNEYEQSLNITNIENGNGLCCYERAPILKKNKKF